MSASIWRKRLALVLAGLGVLTGTRAGWAADFPVPRPAAEQKPQAQVGAQWRFGPIKVDAQNRTLVFPAKVLRREGEVELGIATKAGPADRALLVTEAHPVELHAAFLLLGISGQTVPPLLGETRQDGDWVKLEKTPELKGQEIWMRVRWGEGAGQKSAAFEEWVTDVEGRPAPSGPWIYTGSYLLPNGLFAAQNDGGVLSLVKRPEALINNPRPGRADVHGWLIHSGAVPELGTEVNVEVTVGPVTKEPEEKKAEK